MRFQLIKQLFARHRSLGRKWVFNLDNLVHLGNVPQIKSEASRVRHQFHIVEFVLNHFSTCSYLLRRITQFKVDSSCKPCNDKHDIYGKLFPINEQHEETTVWDNQLN